MHPHNKIGNFDESNDLFDSSIKCYAYQADQPVVWSQKFRDHLVRLYQIGCLVPIKCGQKKKHTSSGVFQSAQDISRSEEMKFGRATIRFVSISEQQFKGVKHSSKSKIFFKGFPLQTSKCDVESVFGRFGSIQYIYFMCSPKSGRTSSKMGYFIYESRDSVDRLLSLKYLVFGQSVITFEEYRTKRSKADKAETLGLNLPHLLDQPRYDQPTAINKMDQLIKATEKPVPFESLRPNRAPSTALPIDGRSPAIDVPESLLKQSSNKCRIKTRIEDDSAGSPASSSRSLIFHFNNKRALTKEYLLRSQEVLENTQDAANLRFNILKSF